MDIDNINRRRLLHLSLKSAIVSFLGTLINFKSNWVFAAYPPKVFKSQSINEILFDLFSSTDAVQSGAIDIDVPLEAEHKAFVPFRISAHGAEKIAVLVNENPEPLVMTADLFGNSDGVVMGTLKMARSSKVSCYVLKQQKLYTASRHVRIAVSGYED